MHLNISENFRIYYLKGDPITSQILCVPLCDGSRYNGGNPRNTLPIGVNLS
ncbi:hypothetical protein HUN01_20205 [Nostoc edaphicum CCNP1411]|uniref:Uncharacterized protein n=1 Tax=Nostoc edaphicum CCNP1411 TaxID=1472755 RepID=A0A7D7LFY9_9NOSO|nr:hypothetical protein [Nostoc edaphicum]QMS89791.1 hypothetical protein HUN01_20205 [Nostoc edaphicum CCNP1411]